MLGFTSCPRITLGVLAWRAAAPGLFVPLPRRPRAQAAFLAVSLYWAKLGLRVGILVVLGCVPSTCICWPKCLSSKQQMVWLKHEPAKPHERLGNRSSLRDHRDRARGRAHLLPREEKLEYKPIPTKLPLSVPCGPISRLRIAIN